MTTEGDIGEVDDEETEEVDTDEEHDEESEEDKIDLRIKKLSNEAAKHRKQKVGARRERDEARVELAFVKATGRRFRDQDAAFKLLDRGLVTVEKDGTINGLSDAIEKLAESNPFLLTGADEPDEEDDPFRSSSSSRKFNGKRKQDTGYDVAALRAKFPALRRLG